MKRKICALLIFLIPALLGGCVKMDVSMRIGKDKRMDLDYTLALHKTLVSMAEDELFSEETIQSLIDQGATVTDYSEGDYSGKKISASIPNIDYVSAPDVGEVDLLAVMNDTNDLKLFRVEKGFLKNTYTANFIVDFAEEGGEDIEGIEGIEGLDLYQATGFDLKYAVHLPVEPEQCNGTLAGGGVDSGYDYTWKLSVAEKNVIQYTFSLINTMNLIFAGAGAALLILLIVIIAAASGRKKKKMKKAKKEQGGATL